MNYNTDINIIGSIPDYHLICKALPLLINDTDNLKKSLVTDNEFYNTGIVDVSHTMPKNVCNPSTIFYSHNYPT